MESRLRMEPLEDRTLLAIDFLAGPLTTPTNRLDVGLGTISGFSPVEPTIVVSPADPGNVAVSSHDRVRLSNDAGGNFTGTFAFTDPPGTTNTGGDTDMIFDSQGRLFWSNLAGIGAGGVSVNEINPTTGANISTVNVRSNGDDKEFITADQTPGSPFQDNLYMVWTGNFGISTTEVYFSRSTNQGVAWSAPMQLSNNAGGEGFPWPSDVGVAPNGDVYVAYHAGGSSGAVGDTWVLRSTDGGVTFPQKNQAFLPGQSDITFNVQTDPGAIPQTQFWMQGAAQPWVLADPARPGNIYIINSDDPNNAHGSAVDDVNIVISRSTNNGLNWATATVPVDAGPGSHQFYPTAAIDEFGNIVLAWYDNRNLATNASGRWLLDVFATYSTDGGVTWATPFQVNDVTNPFDPDIGAVNRFNGPPPTTRIGEYFGIDLFGGTAYVAWNGSNPVGGPQAGHQVVYSAFAVGGALDVSGDLASDTIEVRNIAGNADFVEVIVNGQREYAGLREALTGGITVDTLGSSDNLIVDFTNGNPIPAGGLTYDGGAGANQVTVIGDADYTLTNSSLTRSLGGTIGLTSVQIASLTGGPSANTFDVSGWTGTGNIDGQGGTDTIVDPKDADFTLTGASLVTSDGMNLTLASLEVANLTGGPSDNVFTVQSWSGFLVNLAGEGGSDDYVLGNGDLDTIAAAVGIFDVAGAADSIVLNDNGHAKLADYTIDDQFFLTELTGGGFRPFIGATYVANSIESLTLNASQGANNFYVTPDDTMTFFINGNNPTFAGPGVDYLEVDFTGTQGRKLTYSGPPLGNGMWEFLGAGNPLTGARQNINFTSIEKLNYFEVLATGADRGLGSQPIVKIYDAETGDFSIQFTAYETNYRGGVRVAVGDINGDGIPEVVTTPAGLHAPTVKVFDILTGTQIYQFQGSIPGFSPGLQVAVGDVNGDGRPDIATGWDTGLPYVHVFENTGNNAAPFNNYQAKAGGGLPATPAINAFVGVFTFSFGIGGLAIGDVQGHGVGDIVVASALSLAPVVRVFDYFTNGTSYLPVKQILPFGLTFGVGPLSLAVGNVDSASGKADIVIGASVQGKGRVAVWHNDANAITTFVPYTGIGQNAPVRVALKHTGPGGAAEIFTAQGPGGRSHEIRRFSPAGALVDFILEDDPEFAGGIWLG